MSYTQGPWTANTQRLPYSIPDGPQLWMGFPHERWVGEEGVANARLIAAAPELVEALEGFLNPANFRLTHGDSVFENARALLARIKGD